MKAIAFDTLQYTKGAEAVGVPREQAEYQAQAMANLINEELATKSDLKNAVAELKSEIQKNNVYMIFSLMGAMAAIQAIFHFIG